MSDGRSRGLVFFVLIAVVAGLGGVGIWKLSKGGRPAEEATAGEASAGPRLVKGTGTSWREAEADGDPSGALEGVVRDADGAPVEGATVTISRARARGEEAPSSSYWQPRGTASTAGGGRFRIEKLVPGEYTATAAREGRGPGHRAKIAVKARETARIEIALGREGFLLSGRVLDVGGGAIGGARISAMARTGGSGRAPALFFAASDSEGKYRLTLARGGVSLRVEAEGYAPLLDHEVFLARPTTRDLKLVPAARVAGRVVERGSRQPLADAEVALTSASRTDYREPRDSKTDGSGRFEIEGLEPGAYELMARKGVLIGAGQTVTLAVAQSVTDLEIEVDRAHVVSGRVRDDAGAGIGGVRISANRDGPPFGQAARTRSNPDGTYALEGMLPGGYRLSAWEEGHGFASGRAKVQAADVPNVDLVLPRGVKVSGKVVTADGKPVEGARVRALLETRQTGGGMTSSVDMTTSEPDGAFELTRISPGTVRLTATHDQHGTASLGPEEIKAGEPKVLGLKLEKGSSISGVVRTEEGRPAPDVRVSATSRSPGMSVSASEPDVTGPDGRYRLGNLPAGRVTVAAARGSRPDFDPSSDRADQKVVVLGPAEDKTGVDLVVPPGGLAIKGTVTAPDGKPVPGAIVTAGLERFGRAFRGGSRDLRGYSQVDGAFALEEVGKGPFTLWAAHPDHPEAELKGIAGGSSGVKLAFPPDTSVSGLVVAADGKPVAHYAITVLPGPKPGETPEDRRRRQSSAFDARMQQVQNPGGAFEVRRLAAGTHDLNVSAPGGGSAVQTVTVQPGERKTGVRIQLQAGVRLTGRVIEHGTGKPIPGTMVLAMGRGNARTEAEVGGDGTFVVEGAPLAETIRLSVQADYTRYVSEWKEIEVKPGQTQIDAGTIHLLPGNSRDRMARDPSERGEAGAGVIVENGKAAVRNVRPDSVAARAGLKKGDLVTSINGTGTGELGNGALSYLMSGKPGATLTLVVETPGGGPARTVTLTLEPGKPSPERSN
jgi:protocatechuate 3,4-dioxygenase beta subunit